MIDQEQQELTSDREKRRTHPVEPSSSRPSSSSPLPSPRSSSTPDKRGPLITPTYPLLSTYSLLIFATVWGVLGRLGLEWIGGFAERQVFAVIWAQIVGCIVMGFVTERKEGFESILHPLFTMVGTGFCGSMTTWSTMAHDTFTNFANLDQPSGTSRFAGFLSGVAVTMVTMMASITALRFGVHLHDLLPHFSRHFPSRPSHFLSRLVNLFSFLLGPLFFLGALFLLIFGPSSYRSRATFAIVLGPFGTILRYTLSQHLNSISPRFPLGTFSANVLATLCIAIVSLLARHPNSSLSCAALKGLEDGFCGSLSTVSTLVVELRKLGRGDSWRYFGVTWLVSEAFMVVVLGSWMWSGTREGLCWA